MFTKNYSLLKYNSFGVDISTRFYMPLTHIRQIPEIIEEAERLNQKFIILGEGSNILFTRNFDGLVIHNCIKGIERIAEDESSVFFRVGAGENWDSFVKMTVENNLGGLENLSFIPGSVGASPVQNIGAYGVEVKECIVRTEGYILPEAEYVVFENDECEFGYRDSVFKRNWKDRLIITSVVFRLNKEPVFRTNYGDVARIFEKKESQNLQALRETIIEIRRSKLPDINEFGSAGSFFKNPVISPGEFEQLKGKWPDINGYVESSGLIKIPAAWLIERSGWKGIREGNTGTWPHQPLVLVNYGSATGEEVFGFSEKIRMSVLEQFGIELGREVSVY